MNYKAYDTEDFLQDASFREYCNGTVEESLRFWESWIAEHPEKKAVVEEARWIYRLLNGGSDAEVFRGHRAEMQRRFEQEGIHIAQRMTPVRKLQPKKRAWYWLAAACLIGLVAVTFLLNRNSGINELPDTGHLYSSLPGEKKSFQLPDGTKVILNGGSTLRLETAYNTDSRELVLDGEAFFDVVHNPSAPFIVHSKRFDIKVLGTAFNVRSYNEDKKSVAALIRGKIELLLPGSGTGKKFILRPNQQVVVEDDGSTAVSSSETQRNKNVKPPSPITITPLQLMPYDSTVIETSWTENRLVFYNESFEDVAKKLERWFGVTVTFAEESMKAYRYTGTFDKENLPSIIEALKLSKPFHYKFREEQRLLLIEK